MLKYPMNYLFMVTESMPNLKPIAKYKIMNNVTACYYTFEVYAKYEKKIKEKMLLEKL